MDQDVIMAGVSPFLARGISLSLFLCSLTRIFTLMLELVTTMPTLFFTLKGELCWKNALAVSLNFHELKPRETVGEAVTLME